MRRGNGLRRPAIVLGAVAVLLISSCSEHDDPALDPSGDPAMTAAVRVEANGCNDTTSLGAGSFVARELVLTVAHVVAGSHSVHVILANGQRADATVAAIDRDKDLAVLAVDAHLAPLPRGNMRRGSTGTFVVYRDNTAVSMPFEATAAVEIEAPSIDHDESTERSGYRLTANVEPGDSGSVLVTDGYATGVVFARSTTTGGTAWAIDISEANDLLTQAVAGKAVDVGACVASGG